MDVQYIQQICLDSPDCYNWKRWFAIVPVYTITGKKVWLKRIYKRKVRFIMRLSYGRNPVQDIVQYGTTFDIIANKYQPYEYYRTRSEKL